LRWGASRPLAKPSDTSKKARNVQEKRSEQYLRGLV